MASRVGEGMLKKTSGKATGSHPETHQQVACFKSVGYGANDEHRKPERSRPSTHPTK